MFAPSLFRTASLLFKNNVKSIVRRDGTESTTPQYWPMILGVLGGLLFILIVATGYLLQRRRNPGVRGRMNSTISAIEISRPLWPSTTERAFRPYSTVITPSSSASTFDFSEKAISRPPAMSTTPPQSYGLFPQIPKPVLSTNIPSSRLSYYALNQFQNQRTLSQQGQRTSVQQGLSAKEASNHHKCPPSGFSQARKPLHHRSRSPAKAIHATVVEETSEEASKDERANAPVARPLSPRPPSYCSTALTPSKPTNAAFMIDATDPNDLQPSPHSEPASPTFTFPRLSPALQPAYQQQQQQQQQFQELNPDPPSSGRPTTPSQNVHGTKSKGLPKSSSKLGINQAIAIPMSPMKAHRVMQRDTSTQSLTSSYSQQAMATNNKTSSSLSTTSIYQDEEEIKPREEKRKSRYFKTRSETNLHLKGMGGFGASSIGMGGGSRREQIASEAKDPVRLTISPSLRIVKRRDQRERFVIEESGEESEGEEEGDDEEDWKSGERIVLGELGLNARVETVRGRGRSCESRYRKKKSQC